MGTGFSNRMKKIFSKIALLKTVIRRMIEASEDEAF
jgi:hypothetical protein